MKFSQLINMKMPINVGIFIFIIIEKFTLGLTEQENSCTDHAVYFCLLAGKNSCSAELSMEKSFITLRPEQNAAVKIMTNIVENQNFIDVGGNVTEIDEKL